MVTAGNLDILETWLYQRTGTQLTDTVFDNTDPQPPTPRETEPPAETGRPPPPTTGS
ncbi:hypothetical protein KUM39_23725 [Streptomyces sp. J2-1]|uniref:hypothetical protein n=1 Tax=Streptomyces corallincola TaxID=2851888 RepID=UPI001C391636|nr:hypothetical protein [Streptomyces corallincola]MBV2357344.1 hypothetical protein [Streptomyces corallincola]